VHKPFWRVSAACLIDGYPRQPALAGGRWWNPGTEGGTAMRRWITALIVLGTAGAGVVTAAPAAVAASPGCLVVDTNSNQSYPSSQAAVSAAAAGDTLFVKGTCTGLTVIPTSLTSLTITGQSNGGTKTATLAGRLVIDSVTVTLNDLVFTNSPNAGGGIFARLATVTLNDSTVTNTKFGTGIENASGTVTLNGNSSVTGNTVSQRLTAGGIDNINGTLIMNGNSRVAGNTGDTGGGIQNSGTGRATLIMNGSSTVTGNTASGGGGGIFNNGGTVTLNDSSSITGNTNPGPFGGGIDNLGGGTVTLNNGSSITGNVAGTPGIITGHGGGIYNDCGGTLNGAVSGGNVFGNSPDNIASNPLC